MSARAHIAHRLGDLILGGAGQPIGRWCACGAPLSLAAIEAMERDAADDRARVALSAEERADRVAPVEWTCAGCRKCETLPRWRAEARDYCTPACRKRARRHEDHREGCEGCGTCRAWDKAGT